MTNMLILYVKNNDQCSEAMDLGSFTDGQSITVTGQSNVDATGDSLETPYCAEKNGKRGVWYKFSVAFPARMEVSTRNQADFHTMIVVYSGVCGSLVCETCDDTFGCGITTRVVDYVLPGNIYIFVNTFDFQVGNFDLSMSVTGMSLYVSCSGRNLWKRNDLLIFR